MTTPPKLKRFRNVDLKPDGEIMAAIRRIESGTGLPATGVLRFRMREVFDALTERFERIGKSLSKKSGVICQVESKFV